PLARAALTSGSVDERVAAAVVLDSLDDGLLVELADCLAEAATTGSSQVRDAVQPLLRRAGEAGVPPLRALATEAKPDQPARALELPAAMPDQRDWAIETAVADRAASVRAVAVRRGAAEGVPASEELEIPQPGPLPSWAVPAATADQVAAEV